jgi:hypothetical protein
MCVLPRACPHLVFPSPTTLFPLLRHHSPALHPHALSHPLSRTCPAIDTMQRVVLTAARRAPCAPSSVVVLGVSNTACARASCAPSSAASAALRSVRARGMATEGIVIKDATKADTGVASIAKEEVASSKQSSSSKSSSSSGGGGGGGGASFIWQRFTAFMTGVGVASALLYVRVQEDIWASSAAVQESVAATKADTAEINRSLRERIAVLEHEVALIKRDR